MDSAFKAQISKLKDDFAFRAAREALDAAPTADLSLEDATWRQQQLALCTYKDDELPLTQRLDAAEKILEAIGLRDPATIDAETLALGGAIYKRRWESLGHLEFLNEALAFYRAGWERGQAEDKKIYAAVNAIYLLEVLAGRARSIAQRTGTSIPASVTFAADAEALRRDTLVLAERMHVKDAALTRDYWHQVTLAELHLGRGAKEPPHYALAEAAFRTAAQLSPSEWQLRSSFEQCKALLRCQDIAPPDADVAIESLAPPWRAVAALLGESALLALASHRGKVGLALSGGGFRASLFHLGVLARLAEVDALRSVEVISTVSGGSIVGAHYYLEIQQTLEGRPDADISAADYVAIVRRVQQKFLAGVQKNIRMRALRNLSANLKVAFTKSYTYSRRLGELYERHLYASVTDGRGDAERPMSALLIQPRDTPKDFRPKLSNWRRRAKVPVVVINATSLNSGHNWQFTAKSMGEPPGRLNTDVDANLRYRRLWYTEAPTDELQRFRLGYAVAASACVPGLFEPIVLSDLYAGRTIRLADGGVHDNQGVAGLLDEGCTLMLVSDASGQMDDQTDPANDRIGVPLRSNSILMDRVREAEFEDLQNRVDSRAIQGLLFVHLKQDLDAAPLGWIGSNPPPLPPAQAQAHSNQTDYGIDRDLQRLIAGLRTDLDSFTEVEAHALMLSGYLMTERQLKALDAAHREAATTGAWANLDSDAPREDWSFLALADLMSRPKDAGDKQREDLERQLTVGSAIVFKAWKLSPWLRALSLLLAAGALAGIVYLLWCYWGHSVDVSIGVGKATLALLFLVAGIVLPATRWLRPRAVIQDFVIKLALAFAAFVLAWVHFALVERFFLRAGRLKRLLGLR